MGRVLFVTLGLNLSGQSVHIANLGKGLERLGWEAAIAAGDLADGEPLGRGFFLDRRFEVFEVSFAGWAPSLTYMRNQYRAARELRRLVDGYTPDVIHIHSATLAAVVRAALRWDGKRPGVVTTLNNESIDSGKQALARAANRILRQPFGDRVIAISRSMRDHAVQDLGISPTLIRSIDCAVDEDYFRMPTPAERSAARSSLGLSDKEYVVCCVGRLEADKNQEALIRAAALLRASGIPVRVVLAGESRNGYKTRLAALAHREGVAGAIAFPGFVDARAIYWASDVNVLPSPLEGFGLVVVEGMFCGALAVRSACGGADEQIESQRTGVLIDGNSPGSIADALRMAAHNPDKVQRMRRAAHEHVAGRFTTDRMARQVAAIYREAIDASAVAA